MPVPKKIIRSIIKRENTSNTETFNCLSSIIFGVKFLIPGVIAALSYSMTFYILADDQFISASDALKKSKSMMDGRKMDLFLMSLSFIGWALLCILTLGIGLLWLIPYINVSSAKFYQELKGEEETSSSNSGLIDDAI